MAQDLTYYDIYGHRWWHPRSKRFATLQGLNAVRLQLIDRWIGGLAGKVVIDAGCGGGLLSVPLAQQGARVIGCDLSPRSVRTARDQRAGGAWLAADITRMPVATGCADVVLLADVLEHIPQPLAALREAHRCLRLGGVIYANTLNATHRARILAVVIGEGLGFVPRGTHDWRLFIDDGGLCRAAARIGLRPREKIGARPAVGASLWSLVQGRGLRFRTTTDTSVEYSVLLEKAGRGD